MTTQIAVVNQSTVVRSITSMVAACARQLREHVAPAWDRKTPTVRAFATIGDVPVGWSIVAVLDDADQAGVLGYHDETPDGRPYGRVFAKTVLDHGGTLHEGPNSVSVTLSHELAELFVDPNVELWADDGGTREIAVEVGDPVEASSYDIPYYRANIAVSNFVLPAWFDKLDTSGPWDHLGQLHAPRTMLPGGYLIVRTGGPISDTFARDVLIGDAYPEWKQGSKLAPAARTLRRLR